MRYLSLSLLALLVISCAHQPLRAAELDRVKRPAFISRIDEAAGPKSEVFRTDSSYRPRLKRLDPKEADRRLQLKLASGVSRFEVAERLRAGTASRLPQARPWNNSVDPSRVARVLQSFLVDEVPANAPDYQRVREAGADSIVELVIESYGMRSRKGKAQVFVVGYGRMFTLGGKELWRRGFRADGLDSGLEPLDPFRVAKEPHRFREAMTLLLDAVAVQFATDLTPQDRRRSRASPTGTDELEEGGDDVQPGRVEEGLLPEGELPDPDDPL